MIQRVQEGNRNEPRSKPSSMIVFMVDLRMVSLHLPFTVDDIAQASGDSCKDIIKGCISYNVQLRTALEEIQCYISTSSL